eukprot:UN02416
MKLIKKFFFRKSSFKFVQVPTISISYTPDQTIQLESYRFSKPLGGGVLGP